MQYLDTPVTELKGVGDTRAKQLAKLGINTVRDLVYFFPRAYERRGDVRLLTQMSTEVPTSVILKVGSAVKNARIRKDLTISKFRAYDESGVAEIVFYNSPYVKDVFKLGAEFRFFGKAAYVKNQIQLSSPKYEPYLESKPLADFVPVYPLTLGMSSKFIDKLLLSVIDEAVSNITDHLPEEIRLKSSLPTLSYAIANAHFPKDERSLSLALSRLAFDEMLLFGIGISLCSQFKVKGGGIKFSKCSLSPITDSLPYELTSDQKSAVNDIYRDTVLGDKDGTVSPMARIIVGDVGSGKTICAVMALYISARSGYQSALMVPTEILARQHYADIKNILQPLGISVELLLGSTSAKEKKRIYASLESGETDVVVGTHALISEKTHFSSLGLVVTDEQHRFGVAQRSMLKEKGNVPHMLVMSATPIPRTLALAMYGDLDVSRIVEMPKGRSRVDTFVVDESYRNRLNDFISKQVALGGQCYIVCPSIESREDDGEIFTPESLSNPFDHQSAPDLKNAIDYTEKLRKDLPNVRIEYLHGKMKPAEKDAIMSRFASKETDVLVSTTVIEVGINVPNASLMIVENAERFGLSQLHQLRGRVGRGQRKSYCVLVSDHRSERSKARLEIMRTTYDGYEIADKDLALRGPGDFFSQNTNENLRQSGGFEFKFAKLCDDAKLFDEAFSVAKSIVLKDPDLSLPEHAALRERFSEMLENNSSGLS